MVDDPRIRWHLANPFGIAIDLANETWWSGRVFDVAELDGGDNGVLVGTETGGVWMVDADNNALPLSNTWTNPNVNCLAAGPDGPRHFFAAGVGSVIYETDASHSTPLLQWAPVKGALPPGAGDVYDIAVLRRHRIVIAACVGGLYWSLIPEAPPWWCVLAQLPPKSGARPPYKWERAEEEILGQAGYFSLAVTSMTGRTERAGEEDLRNIGIVAGGLANGVFLGRWSGGKLRLKRSRVLSDLGDLTDLVFALTSGPSSVAACDGFPRRVYAACAKSDGRLQTILHSTDGGQTWRMTPNDVKVGTEDRDIRVQAGDQGAGGGPNNCIAVDPTAPGVVAFGWQDGTFVSPDAGKTWIRVGGEVHHADVHVLLFKRPTPDDKHLLYIGSDGGLAQVNVNDVIGGAPVVARSDYNRRLATLQFYSTWVTRQFYGTTSVSPTGNGKVSAGIHDNGNVSCELAGPATPWLRLDGGDGGWNAIVADGGLVRNVMGTAAIEGHAVAGGFVGAGVISIQVPAPPDPSGVVSPIGDVVRRPSFRNLFGQRMFAAAGNAGKPVEVYGLFQDGPEQTYHWERLGTTPGGLAVSAAASFSGGTVMVAAGAGRIFAMDSKNGTTLELPVVLPKPSPALPQTGGSIPRIAMLRADIGFAILNSTSLKNNYILRLEGLKWVVPMSNNLPLNAAFYGIDGFLSGDGRPTIFVATDDKIYMSEDAGENWVQASADLPRVPHCADLRVGVIAQVPTLLLGTFGRSMWRASLERLEPR